MNDVRPGSSASQGGRGTALPESSERRSRVDLDPPPDPGDNAPAARSDASVDRSDPPMSRSDAPMSRSAEPPDDLPVDTVPYAPSRAPSAAVPAPAPPRTVPADEPANTSQNDLPATGVAEPAHRLPRQDRPRRQRRASPVLALVLLLVVALTATTVHFFRTSVAWQDRADTYLADARGLGVELATERLELAGYRAELAAVREQLATAHGRIVELADEKAQLGDDREVQRQLVDYQERVSGAAGQVAHALDQCVQGQQQLIGYLQQTVEGAAQYDADELSGFTSDVDDLCQAASEANMSLQRELSR